MMNFTLAANDCAYVSSIKDGIVDMINNAMINFYNAHQNESGIDEFMSRRAILSVSSAVIDYMEDVDQDDMTKALERDFRC